MGLVAKGGFSGIVTAIAETQAQPGALAVADNVTLRREGALEARETFANMDDLQRVYRAVVPYAGSNFFIGDYAGNKNYVYRPNEAVMFQILTPPVREDIQSAREARGNLYFAASSGIFKIANAGVTALERTGLMPGDAAPFNQTTITGGWLPLNWYVGYRYVTVRTDANGVVLRSRPTGTVLVGNLTATDGCVPSLSIALRAGAVVDAVEVYRTRAFPVAVQLDDEMQLVASLAPALFVGTPRMYTFVDSVEDWQRGITLYTSPSRGGMENANDRPPGAAVLERFRGSLFMGNLHQPARVVFSYRQAGNEALTGSATGIGMRQATGNTANGSTSLTGVTPLTGVYAGSIVNGPGVSAFVTAVAGSTVTISPAATASGTGVTLYFHDAIQYTINGSAYGAIMPPTSTGSSPAYALSFNGQVTAYEITPPQPGYDVTVVLESRDRGPSGSFTLMASHGNEYNPPLPTTPTAIPWEAQPNGLAWSDPDEPEHVPPRNFARIGDAGKAILGLVALRDCLLIFKEDGLFRLSGYVASQFRVDTIDPTCVCVLPTSIKRLQNSAYSLTTQGLACVHEGNNVVMVSRPIQNELAPIITAIRNAQRSSGLYLMPGFLGIAGAVDEPNGEYLLALGSSTPSFGGQLLVYSAQTSGYTTYSFQTAVPVALGQNTLGRPVVLTSTQLLEPSPYPNALVARMAPHGFCAPEMLDKLWSHAVIGFSDLWRATDVSMVFSSSVPMVEGGTPQTVKVPIEPVGGHVELPGGTLLRALVPRVHARAWTLRCEVRVTLDGGRFVLELVGVECRQNLPNHEPVHSRGVT